MDIVKDKWFIGLMSGTSCDGIDVAFLKTDGVCVFEYGPSFTVPYETGVRSEVRSIFGYQDYTDKVRVVEDMLTQKHIDAVHLALGKYAIAKEDVFCIGCHGQTIFHAPRVKKTFQIINGQKMADTLGIPVVYDFRSHDVKHGGEGAPLVPIFHQSIGEDFPKPFLFLNIGGVSNVTLVTEDNIYACDVGPGNALVDDLMEKDFQKPMDENGDVALRGRVRMDDVVKFLQRPFFKQPYPKSLDRNEFYVPFADTVPSEDKVATTTALTAFSVLKNLAFFREKPLFCVVAGGGIYNKSIMKMLKILMPFPVMALTDHPQGKHIDPNGVEGFAFAFLAARVLQKMPITFPHTTGCAVPLCGGKVAMPRG